MTRQDCIAVIRSACAYSNGPKFLLSTTVPPVNLADVLLAFQVAERDDELAVLQDGRFAILTQGRLELIPEACWDLRSNCLQEQSGETLDLIARLLKSESPNGQV